MACRLSLRRLDELEAGSDHLIERPPGIDNREILLPEIELKLLIEDRRCGIGHITRAARNPASHGLGGRVEPKTGECSTRTRGNLGDGVTLFSLGVHRIDDDRVPALKRHQGALAADGVNDIGNLRGIGGAGKPLLAGDAEQALALDVAPHEHRPWKRAKLRRKRLRHARLAAAR